MLVQSCFFNQTEKEDGIIFALVFHMQSWLQYLAFLKWQNQPLMLDDFKKVVKNYQQIDCPDDLIHFVSHPHTKEYLRHQKYWWKQAEQDYKQCLKSKIKITWPYHSDYPDSLFSMERLPALISWYGETCWKKHFLFSTVGSRHPHTDTLLWMDIHLGTFLKNKSELCLISGGARGVDQKAHALSLASKKPTICFLPCGIKNFYPSNLQKWFHPIIENGGAFVSVFPFSSPMRKSHFHIRNEVLATVSDLVFIAQAAPRSGTMVTARYALHSGVTLCTLPGSPLYAGYKGNLNLINDGCFMVRDYLDLETLYQSCRVHISQKTTLIRNSH